MEILLPIAKWLVTAVYATALIFLCIFGFHRHYLTYIFKKSSGYSPEPKGGLDRLPPVTVQLPVYNEMHVVERLISSVCNIDYPKELIEIQVLDDSSDETGQIARACVENYRSRGFQINYIPRNGRAGFKAGALSNGLKYAKGELIAIFDADFIPPRDFLQKTVPFFADPKVGAVQTRWGHVNRDYSSLTKAQSILLDGHFLIEQASRFYGGKFFNFNGTAGILKKECIESAGGWQHDTLTEDMDLSYRAQLKGWKFIYLKNLTVDAELPVDMNAFKSQQHRWAKGAIQTAKKLLPQILRSKELPAGIKVEACFHLLGNLCYLLLVVLLVLMLPIAYFWRSIGWTNVVLLNLIAVSAGTMSVVRFYLTSLKEARGKEWTDYLKYVPLAIALGTGIAVNNSKAVLEALLGRQSEFKRTPKYAVISKRDSWQGSKYVTKKEITTLIELTLGIFFVLQTVYAFFMDYIGWIPFLFIIQIGFLYTSVLSLTHGLRREPFIENRFIRRSNR